jgi:hypothetical protein
MAVVEQKAVVVPSQPRSRPAWLDFLLSVLHVGIILPVSLLTAVLQGFLLGESDPDKYRPLAPDNRKDRSK